MFRLLLSMCWPIIWLLANNFYDSPSWIHLYLSPFRVFFHICEISHAHAKPVSWAINILSSPKWLFFIYSHFFLFQCPFNSQMIYHSCVQFTISDKCKRNEKYEATTSTSKCQVLMLIYALKLRKNSGVRSSQWQ